MAGNKKKKKPASNPARGFATTSIASTKPRVEEESDVPKSDTTGPTPTPGPGGASAAATPNPKGGPSAGPAQPALSPEEFEKQLEESELQLLVEKHAPKVKRDAQRQKTRLVTDRRIQRSGADAINCPKWLPPDIMDEILDLIQAESRYASASMASEVSSNNSSGKMLPEEDLTMRLWSLQHALVGAGIPESRVREAVAHVLNISPNIPSASKDTLWGLEEALDWLAKECPPEELPPYDGRGRQGPKPIEEPEELEEEPEKKGSKSNGTSTPSRKGGGPRPKKKPVVVCDSDIEPDDLMPEYLKAKTRLFELERPFQDAKKGGKKQAKPSPAPTATEDEEMEMAKLRARIERIEKDVLFYRELGEHEWKTRRIALEKDFIASRKEESKPPPPEPSTSSPAVEPDLPDTAGDAGAGSDGDINLEAERMAAEILAQNDSDDSDGGLGEMFASLPVTEVDAVTGKSNTVVNNADGSKLFIRDFAKWAGVSPLRVLEEACRSRDSSVKLTYKLVSDVPFANRHMVTIDWKKPQEIFADQMVPEISVSVSPSRTKLTMVGVATPDKTKSEAYIATYALFHIFGGSTKEDKVFLRLPPVWRDLYTEYSEIRKDQLDAADRAEVRDLRALVRQRRDQELEDGVILQGFRGRVAARQPDSSKDDSSQERGMSIRMSEDHLRGIWAAKSSTKKFQTMLQSRSQLPMWAFKSKVIETIDNNQVVILCGETGCGKSTQLPSFILEHQLSLGKHCKIYCAEPRRISAVSLARRVSEELGENRGDIGTNRSLVGYSIRLESNTSRETRLVYATTGIVMRMLEGSNDLSEITHLVLDEVHERTIDSDFLLIVLKKLMKRRPDLKVVLMSATVDADRFSNYLDGAPILEVPGRTFPVQTQYLEDAVELTGYQVGDGAKNVRMVDLDDDVVEPEVDTSSKAALMAELTKYSPRTRAVMAQMDEYRIDFDLIVQLISKVSSDESYAHFSKAVLVFMPGMAEIRTLNDMLLGHPIFGSAAWRVYPLHSSIATEEQEEAFVVPPPGVRKIVIATNIAETGITIPDVTCVIDAGKHKEMRFDERRQLSRLIDTFISRANAKQRRGRAGRVQEGLCFHLFTKYRHDRLMSDAQTPEMLRLSLQDLAIRVKICKIGGIEETLSEALDAPSSKNIRRAIDALVDVRALTAAEELTPLGHQLARLPLDVFLGKLILLGTVFKCLDMALTVAAILSSKSPFSAPFGQRTQADAARMAFRRGDSDLLTIYNAYISWRRVCKSTGKDFQFCRKNYLSQQTLANIEDLKGQLLVAVADSGFLSLTDDERKALGRLRFARGRRQQFFEAPERVSLFSENDAVTASVIAWSFYPKLLVRDPPGSRSLRNIGNNQGISLHPTSVNKGALDVRWLAYYHIMRAKQVYHAHETTGVDPFAIALLCGDVRCDVFSGVITLDGNRARFSVPDWKTMLVIKVLRARLREVLGRAFKHPGKPVTAQQEKWLEVWGRIFAEGKETRKA
ncbi:related to DNA/RNA helicase (DEAD/H box family II) [Cephalotrichum gorgonifer]|uniref:RNA helicase n=1 Tax=Cephalotrichum gorgonifer TaxID=2041049 RepID=A0AAE8N888_9PEZI|nr:related to DNA/RNA helicase (DEAD/H box family II) [Cephalotrichum gorgonifer]